MASPVCHGMLAATHEMAVLVLLTRAMLAAGTPSREPATARVAPRSCTLDGGDPVLGLAGDDGVHGVDGRQRQGAHRCVVGVDAAVQRGKERAGTKLSGRIHGPSGGVGEGPLTAVCCPRSWRVLVRTLE